MKTIIASTTLPRPVVMPLPVLENWPGLAGSAGIGMSILESAISRRPSRNPRESRGGHCASSPAFLELSRPLSSGARVAVPMVPMNFLGPDRARPAAVRVAAAAIEKPEGSARKHRRQREGKDARVPAEADMKLTPRGMRTSGDQHRGGARVGNPERRDRACVRYVVA